jgi:hypothetical protein
MASDVLWFVRSICYPALLLHLLSSCVTAVVERLVYLGIPLCWSILGKCQRVRLPLTCTQYSVVG